MAAVSGNPIVLLETISMAIRIGYAVHLPDADGNFKLGFKQGNFYDSIVVEQNRIPRSSTEMTKTNRSPKKSSMHFQFPEMERFKKNHLRICGSRRAQLIQPRRNLRMGYWQCWFVSMQLLLRNSYIQSKWSFQHCQTNLVYSQLPQILINDKTFENAYACWLIMIIVVIIIIVCDCIASLCALALLQLINCAVRNMSRLAKSSFGQRVLGSIWDSNPARAPEPPRKRTQVHKMRVIMGHTMSLHRNSSLQFWKNVPEPEMKQFEPAIG